MNPKYIKYNYFSFQYGNEKESHEVLIYHPNPHSIDRFLSHFDGAIILAATRLLVQEASAQFISDFLLTEMALDEIKVFQYKKNITKIHTFF